MPRPKPTHVGAFFDVDKTILAENSGTAYLKLLYERGEIDWKPVAVRARLVPALQAEPARHRALDREEQRACSRAAASPRLAQEAAELFQNALLPSIYPEAEARVRWHLEQGHLVALVSGSTQVRARAAGRAPGREAPLCTQLEVEDGVFTGRVVRPICFGEGKIYWIQQLIERELVDLARSWFYTDSITDLPLLDLVGHPVDREPRPAALPQGAAAPLAGPFLRAAPAATPS